MPGNATMEQFLECYVTLLCKVSKDFPNLKVIGTQLRGAHSTDRIDWCAVLYDVAEDTLYQAATRRQSVVSFLLQESRGARYPNTVSWSFKGANLQP